MHVSSSSKTLIGALVGVCGYFLVLFSARSFAEWSIWRLRHQSPIVKLQDLAKSIYLAGSRRSDELRRASHEALRKYMAQIEGPALIAELQAVADRAWRIVREDPDVLNETAWEQYEAARDKLEEARKNWETDVITPAREALDRANAEVEAGQKENFFVKPIQYIAEAIGPASRILPFRLSFEILFPIAFGALAVMFGVVALAQPTSDLSHGSVPHTSGLPRATNTSSH
jgi:hypothetical protein